MEHEIRFYFPTEQKDGLLRKLQRTELTAHERNFEKTIQYDTPDSANSFYSPEIDGRFRVRNAKGKTQHSCKVSWKQRTPNTRATEINSEIEREFHVDAKDYENLVFILEKILKLKPVESYERYRTIFDNNEIEIALDEYPFGIALEIESKPNRKNPQEIIKKWAERLKLDTTDAFRLSWDDKYTELCKKQGVEIFKHVSFDKPMPQVK